MFRNSTHLHKLINVKSENEVFANNLHFTALWTCWNKVELLNGEECNFRSH
jgi:hypothetical protein